MTSDNTNVLILAGGMGTRLKPITNNLPKCLVPIVGKPLLDYWIDSLILAGFNRAVINTHYLAEQVRLYIDITKNHYQFELIESFEKELLGSAGTISNNIGLADKQDYIVVIYADNLSDVSISDFLNFHKSHTEPVSMMLFHAENPSQCGIATLDSENNISDFVEKPENPTSDLANAGLYIFDAKLYRDIAISDSFDIGHDVLPLLAGKMRGFIHDGYHRDIGTMDSLAQANEDITNGIFKVENV